MHETENYFDLDLPLSSIMFAPNIEGQYMWPNLFTDDFLTASPVKNFLTSCFRAIHWGPVVAKFRSTHLKANPVKCLFTSRFRKINWGPVVAKFASLMLAEFFKTPVLPKICSTYISGKNWRPVVANICSTDAAGANSRPSWRKTWARGSLLHANIYFATKVAKKMVLAHPILQSQKNARVSPFLLNLIWKAFLASPRIIF